MPEGQCKAATLVSHTDQTLVTHTFNPRRQTSYPQRLSDVGSSLITSTREEYKAEWDRNSFFFSVWRSHYGKISLVAWLLCFVNFRLNLSICLWVFIILVTAFLSFCSKLIDTMFLKTRWICFLLNMNKMKHKWLLIV